MVDSRSVGGAPHQDCHEEVPMYQRVVVALTTRPKGSPCYIDACYAVKSCAFSAGK